MNQTQNETFTTIETTAKMLGWNTKTLAIQLGNIHRIDIKDGDETHYTIDYFIKEKVYEIYHWESRITIHFSTIKEVEECMFHLL